LLSALFLLVAIASSSPIVSVGSRDPDSQPGEILVLPEKLPHDCEDAAAFWDGRYIYVLGGSDSEDDMPTDAILRFDPLTETVVELPEKLPSPRDRFALVWTGRYAFLFGGVQGRHTLLDQIVKYDPQTGNVTILPERLPTPRFCTVAVWTGKYAYLFGGCDENGHLDEILRYDPSTGELEVLEERLPSGRRYITACWDGRYAFITGGTTGAKALDEIVRYDPQTGNVTVIARLPSPRYGVFSIYVEPYVYIFGGYNGFLEPPVMYDDVLRYDPSTGSLETLPERLPKPLATPAIAWTGKYVYIFGGCCMPYLAGIRDILRYKPSHLPSTTHFITETVTVTESLTFTETLTATTTIHTTVTERVEPLLPLAASFGVIAALLTLLSYLLTRHR